ncbi:hypothetical protein [Butyrivibrio sp. MC2013]|uniref:hypothetical protein n=1 Tax=Butyrivibrio sp. MC2013 TaxID=1280686 RepID=UPI0012DF5741|nr:hypothetical protein [Butyrivibrio sp. MC2013]
MSKEEKAEDNHSSAIVLLSCGIVGLAGVIFILTKNPLHMQLFNRYMSAGVMGALFVLFIVSGLVSLRNYKRFSSEAALENNLRSQLHDWCLENLTPDEINNATGAVGDNAENYFVRISYMKEAVMKKFMNLDENLLDRFLDSYYSEIYDRIGS